MKPLLRPFFLFFHSSFLLLSYEVKVSKATMDEVDGCERSSDCIDKYWRTIWIIIGMAIAAYSFMLAWTCWISSKFQILGIKIFQILVKYLVFGLKILCVFCHYLLYFSKYRKGNCSIFIFANIIPHGRMINATFICKIQVILSCSKITLYMGCVYDINMDHFPLITKVNFAILKMRFNGILEPSFWR